MDTQQLQLLHRKLQDILSPTPIRVSGDTLIVGNKTLTFKQSPPSVELSNRKVTSR
jgi:hypothetical protein